MVPDGAAASVLQSAPGQTCSAMTVDMNGQRGLSELVEVLGRTGWAVELFDPRWRLVWVSQGVRAVLGEHDEGRLGYGRHLVEAWNMPVRRAFLTAESRSRSLAEVAAMTFGDTPGGKEALRGRLGDGWPPEVDPVMAVPAPDVWAWSVEFVPPGADAANRLQALMVRVRAAAGTPIGTFFLYSSGLPASIFALLVRGDEELFARTAELVEPRTHATAIQFADLEGSAALAHSLAPKTYFELLRALLTGIDGLVAAHGGIVGKHGGDGATAFFLAEQLGSPSEAATAALAVARAIPGLADSVVARTRSELELSVNVGAHWADHLYLGQVITGGRLEVTALGDEVNECARLQQSAHGGQLLASKALLERIKRTDEVAPGPPDAYRFTPLREVPGATTKAIRDAGDLQVASV